MPRTFGDPEPTPTLRSTLQWLSVQLAGTLREVPHLSAPMRESLTLWLQTTMDTLKQRPPESPDETRINITSLLSQRDHRGRVELNMNDVIAQLLPGEALSLARELMACSEAARVDQTVYMFAKESLNLSEEQATMVLQESRKYRESGELEWEEQP